VLVFVALGHFERKGLPLLLDALGQLQSPRLKLLVVGGEADVVLTYRARADCLGLQQSVIFVGMQQDVRPYLWSAEAFVLPSTYETFSLVAFEAAAAGLPLIVTPFYGVEEFFQDGEHGLLIECSRAGMHLGLTRFLALPSEQRKAMGARIREQVRKYNVENFTAAWRRYFDSAPNRTLLRLKKTAFVRTATEE